MAATIGNAIVERDACGGVMRGLALALADRARVVTVQGIDTPLADLADIIRSKRAAGRPKDRLTLPQLEEALRRRDAGTQ